MEMFFDDQAEAAVRAMWDVPANAGLPSLATRTHRRHRPHISLSVTESLADSDLTELRSVLADQHPTLHLYVLGTFPGDEGLLFLGVPVTTDLLTLHTRVHTALSGRSVGHWPYYLPDNWVPHCTLAQGLDRAGLAKPSSFCMAPVVATVTAVGITDTETGQVTLLTS